MGLLLSVLITCVGVLEVVAFYTNFNLGVAYNQYKSDLTDIARSYAWELRRNHLHHLFPDGDPEEEFSRMLETQRSKLASTRSLSRIRGKEEDDNISVDEDSTYDQISEIDNEIPKTQPNGEIYNDKANEIIFVSGPLEKEIAESIEIEELPKDDENQMETTLDQKHKVVAEFIQKEVGANIPTVDLTSASKPEEPQEVIEETIQPTQIARKPDQISEEPTEPSLTQTDVTHPKEITQEPQISPTLPKHIEEEIILTSKHDLETKICSPINNDDMRSFLDQLESQIITDESEFDQKSIDKVEPPYIKKEAAPKLHGTSGNPGEIVEELCVQKRFVDLTDKADGVDISAMNLSADLKEDIKELAEERFQLFTGKSDENADEEFLKKIQKEIVTDPIIEEMVQKSNVSLGESRFPSGIDQELAKVPEMVSEPVVEEIVQKSNVPLEGSRLPSGTNQELEKGPGSEEIFRKSSVPSIENRLPSGTDQELAELTKDPSKLGAEENQHVERVPSPYPMSLFGLSTGNGITDLVVNEHFLRSLDGVKPSRTEDRRRSFRKKRNSSSSSKDRASRDRSNDSTEARTELDLKEIEALDALAERNGSFEENCVEENESKIVVDQNQNLDQPLTKENKTVLQNEPKIIPETIPRDEQTSSKMETKSTEFSAESVSNTQPNQQMVDLSSFQEEQPSSIQPKTTDLQKSTDLKNQENFQSAPEAANPIPIEDTFQKEVQNLDTNDLPSAPEVSSSSEIEILSPKEVPMAPISSTPVQEMPNQVQANQESKKPTQHEASAEVSSVSKENSDTSSAEPKMQNPKEASGETSAVPKGEPDNSTSEPKMQIPKEASGKASTVLKEKTGSSSAEVKGLSEDLPEEVKKAQSVHKIDETVPNSSPKTLAQEANAILLENRRKFFKTASVNSFEDASSSQNEEMNQRELNKVNGQNNENQKMSTTISLPNSDAFWVKE